jgi:hypothetical protein
MCCSVQVRRQLGDALAQLLEIRSHAHLLSWHSDIPYLSQSAGLRRVQDLAKARGGTHAFVGTGHARYRR